MRVVTTLPWGRELTEADLESHPFGDARVELVDGSLRVSRPTGYLNEDLWDLPSDGHRYELLDGVLLVTPSPSPQHQIAAANLFRALDASCPGHLRVLFAPLDIPLAIDTTLEPDLLVIDKTDQHGGRQLPRFPLLTVEILSPSTRRFDLVDKRSRYERSAVPSYWVVDPVDPRLRVWRLDDGQYVEVADVGADEEWTAEAPYPVTIRPSDLLK